MRPKLPFHRCSKASVDFFLQHNENYVVFPFYLDYKTKSFNLAAVFDACGHNIDAGRIDRAVTQDVGELGDILFNAVEGAGEEFPQIVGKNFRRLHTGGFAQLLHSSPDITAVQRFACASNEDRAGDNIVPLGIIQQNILQFAWNENRPGFVFSVHSYFTLLDRLYSKILQLRHPDTCSANGLDHQI